MSKDRFLKLKTMIPSKVSMLIFVSFIEKGGQNFSKCFVCLVFPYIISLLHGRWVGLEVDDLVFKRYLKKLELFGKIDDFISL